MHPIGFFPAGPGGLLKPMLFTLRRRPPAANQWNPGKFQDLKKTQNYILLDIFWFFFGGHPIILCQFDLIFTFTIFFMCPFRMSAHPRNRLIRDGKSMTYPDTTTCGTAQEFTTSSQASIPNRNLRKSHGATGWSKLTQDIHIGCPRKLVNGLWMGYNLLINGVYWGYTRTNHLLTSWDIQVVDMCI